MLARSLLLHAHMTNLMPCGSLSVTGAPGEVTLVTVGSSSVAMLGMFATLTLVGLLVASMVSQRRRNRRGRIPVSMTTGWAGASA